MKITGEYVIPAPRTVVWDALNDPAVLKAAIPGCEELEKTGENTFAAQVIARIGAIKAKFRSAIELRDIDVPNGYTIAGQGQGGMAGFAKGSARVTLDDAPEGSTVLRYEADADLGGKLAAVGSRVIQGVAKKMADDFFGAFVGQIAGPAQPAAAAPAPAPATGTAAGIGGGEAPAPAPSAVATASAPAAAPAERRAIGGETARDLLWFFIGAAAGAAVVWGLLG